MINTTTTGRLPNGWTCLHLAAEGNDKVFGSADLVRVLLDAKAEIEGKIDKGNTAIAIAAATGVVDVVRVLIEYNADPTVVNNEKKGILQNTRDSSGTMESILVHETLAQPTNVRGCFQSRQGVGASRFVRYMRHVFVRGDPPQQSGSQPSLRIAGSQPSTFCAYERLGKSP